MRICPADQGVFDHCAHPSNWHTFHGMTPRRATHIILFDDECPLCTFQMKVLTWLDWFNILSLAPVSQAQSAALAPNLTRDALLEAIHCVTPEGRIYRGARCLRFVGLRLPSLVPVALFLWFPGVIWVAEKAYQWVSRNRHLLSRWFGCKEACAILPQRRRANEKDIVLERHDVAGP